MLGLLLMATILACLAHWQRRRLRAAIAIVLALAILAPFGLVTFVLGFGVFFCHVISGLFCPLALLTLLMAAGFGWMLWTGLRRGQSDAARPQAANWPRGKLATCFAIAIVLQIVTLWILDLAARQRLEALRSEGAATTPRLSQPACLIATTPPCFIAKHFKQWPHRKCSIAGLRTGGIAVI